MARTNRMPHYRRCLAGVLAALIGLLGVSTTGVLLATFVLDTSGFVRYANVRGNWTELAEPTEVLDVLVELARPYAA